MFAVTAEQMRKLDSAAISLGVDGTVLMENAAFALVCEILPQEPSSVIVFCGKGQNGGDGFAAARQLFCRKINVKIILACPAESIMGDARKNYEAAKKIGVPIENYDNNKTYTCDVIIDALFGTGLSKIVEGTYAEIINSINKSGAFIISADIPSGISADTGKVCGTSVKASKTVTFGFIKTGLLSPLSADYIGDLVLDEISIPRNICGTEKINTYVTEPSDIRLPAISRSAHKGNNGRVLIAGGKSGMAGAVYLAAAAAEKSGAGLVTCGVPKEMVPCFMNRLTNAMCEDIENVDFSAFDTVVFGNGLGTGEKAAALLKKALCETKKTLVIDADGINLLARNPAMLYNCKAEIILTPHPMEFSRLTGKELGYIIENRIECSREFAAEYGVTLVFKGPCSVVTFSDKTAYINNTGNEGMAKGGSGDVLSGIIGGLANHYHFAQKAALAGVYLHGLAGDIAKENIGAYSMTAEDIISYIPKAYKKI